MLPKLHRLTEDKDFNRLFKSGRSAHGKGVGVRFLRGPKEDTRIAFVVSTKISKDAVVRNTIKRRMREIVRPLLPNMTKGIDIIISAKPESKTMDFATLKTALTELLHRQRLV